MRQMLHISPGMKRMFFTCEEDGLSVRKMSFPFEEEKFLMSVQFSWGRRAGSLSKDDGLPVRDRLPVRPHAEDVKLRSPICVRKMACLCDKDRSPV